MRAELNWRPERLDVEAFAQAGVVLQGQWAASTLVRWCESQWPEVGAELPPVEWELRGEWRERLGAAPQVWLWVRASTGFRLECQRCLQALEQPLAVQRGFRFVRDEALAEAEDLDSEEDLLVLSRAFDARELVEDELLLGLPLVPLHADCQPPGGLTLSTEDPAEALEERPHPFAALAALKKV